MTVAATGGGRDLFGGPSPRVFSLPPSAAFLDELARGLVEGLDARGDPERLADAVVFTPNQRASRELALALHRAMGGTTLAPTIRALGDVDTVEDRLAFGVEAFALPPAVSPAERRGALARLIQGWRTAVAGETLPPEPLLAAADELAALIDQGWHAGGVDWGALSGAMEELAPGLAQHWQSSAEFLEIVLRAWPAHLSEIGKIDVQQRRFLAASALAERWRRDPPQAPVIIAGSTGAGAASRVLMRAVLELPRGAIVLPGLDAGLREQGWQAVAESASHPQFVLQATLKAIGVPIKTVRQFPHLVEAARPLARRRLIAEALAPATQTRDWRERLAELAGADGVQNFVLRGLEGLRLIEAEDENQEALIAALLLRETLETGDRTAALVTPEAGLARRVAATLNRWGLDVAPSAGTPLSLSPTGSLLLLLSRWILDPADPNLLLAVMKHEHVGLGVARAERDRLISDLERHALRGPRRSQTLDDLAARLASLEPARANAAELVFQIARVHAQLAPLLSPHAIDAAGLVEALADLAEVLAQSPDGNGARIWTGAAGAMCVALVDETAALARGLGLLAPREFPELLSSAAQRLLTPPDAAEHTRIAIWGPLEARLQHRDRMILASLNEGVWPKPAAPDAFLNRTLRARLGLADPDERIGLAAHDFAQFANAPEVVLLRARRADNKPAVASRWLWRLRTLASGGLGPAAADLALRGPVEHDPIRWARAVRSPREKVQVCAPQPRPPVEARALGAFSPSRVVRLIRDPYADYARSVLRLRPLRRVGEDVDVRERGTAVHKAVELFEAPGNEFPLDQLIRQQLYAASAAPELVELEAPLWRRAAAAYQKWSRQRAPRRIAFETEKRASITLETAAGTMTLGATADRVEQLADGTLVIIDFKTGAPKSPSQVESGLEPQLSLEAAIGARAGFGRIAPAPTSELIYFRMSLSPRTGDDRNGQPLTFNDRSTMDIAEEALHGLAQLVAQYSDAAQPYLSKPRVFKIWIAEDYDRLARRGEWTTDEGGDDSGD